MQIVPPLLMFAILPMTTSGTALVYLSGLLLLPVLVSVISIVVKAIFFRKKKYHLVRPLLTIAVFLAIIFIANRTYQVALEQTVIEARKIHRQCNENSACPENPQGWLRDGSWIRKTDLGPWFKYTASYHYDKRHFRIRVYQGPDTGDNISGGVALPFEVSRHLEDRD